MKDEKSKTIELSEFPKRIKQLRQQRGWSQGQLAKEIDADIQRISKYERGLMAPGVDAAIKIARVFDVSLDYLLGVNKNTTEYAVKNKNVLDRVAKLDSLLEEDEDLLVRILDLFIKQKKIEHVIHS